MLIYTAYIFQQLFIYYIKFRHFLFLLYFISLYNIFYIFFNFLIDIPIFFCYITVIKQNGNKKQNKGDETTKTLNHFK